MWNIFSPLVNHDLVFRFIAVLELINMLELNFSHSLLDCRTIETITNIIDGTKYYPNEAQDYETNLENNRRDTQTA